MRLVLAAISVSGMTSRVTDARLPLIGGIVREVAAELTLALGGVMPGTKRPERAGQVAVAFCQHAAFAKNFPNSRAAGPAIAPAGVFGVPGFLIGIRRLFRTAMPISRLCKKHPRQVHPTRADAERKMENDNVRIEAACRGRFNIDDFRNFRTFARTRGVCRAVSRQGRAERRCTDACRPIGIGVAEWRRAFSGGKVCGRRLCAR